MTDDDQALWQWCLEKRGWTGLTWIDYPDWDTIQSGWVGCEPGHIVADNNAIGCPPILTDRNASIAWVEETLTKAQKKGMGQSITTTGMGVCPRVAHGDGKTAHAGLEGGDGK